MTDKVDTSTEAVEKHITELAKVRGTLWLVKENDALLRALAAERDEVKALLDISIERWARLARTKERAEADLKAANERIVELETMEKET